MNKILISLFSLYSQYSLTSLALVIMVGFAVTKYFSQPTQRGHTPLRYMLPTVGAGEGILPFEPCLSVPFVCFRFGVRTSSTQRDTLAKKGSSR